MRAAAAGPGVIRAKGGKSDLWSLTAGLPRDRLSSLGYRK